MRIKPRQQLLDLWRAVLAHSYRDGVWVWGGRDGSNSISDAEQLLCLLYPATEIRAFALDQPDGMATDVLATLEPWGAETRIGGVVVGLLEEYVERHTDADGEPVFHAGSYLRAENGHPTEAQRALEVVDSYSMSLSLGIAALRFLRGYQRSVAGEVRLEARRLRDRIPPLIEAIGTRLTAAMTGLVRSFVIHTPDPRSAAGREIVGMLNQAGSPPDEIIGELSAQLERLRVQAANEVRLSQTSEIDVADDTLLFECGWGWGIVRSAAPVEFVRGRIGSAPGYAESRPYLYFTAVALDGIVDLSSQRIRELDLLTDEQRALADALQLRFELARTYWSTVARFGTGPRWPLEDIPWRTSDGEESDYFSLTVTAVLVQDLVYRESTDDLARTVAVFDQLARRGRITSRLTSGDPAGTLHHPGVRLGLAGSEELGNGSRVLWHVPDFSTMMLKRCLQAARLRTDVATRNQLMVLAEAAMEHLDGRALREGPAARLWDDPARIGLAAESPGPSWFVTERVMECLVIAHDTFSRPPLSPATMVARAVDLLNEAEHLLNQEELRVEGEDGTARHSAVDRIRQSLDRARLVLGERPGTAYSLATKALIDLDQLAYARQDAMRA